MRSLAKYGIGITSLLLLLGAVGLLVAATPLFGNKALIVRSGSMEPTISVGDLVVVRPTASYRVDDIISFTAGPDNKTVITHRIVEVSESENPRTYTTKGDANEQPDEFLVEEKNIFGRRLVVVPYVGTLLAFAKTRLGFSLLVLLPTLFVVVGEGLAIYREMRQRKKEERVETVEPARTPRTVVAPQSMLRAQLAQPAEPTLKPHVKPPAAPSYRAYRPPALTFTASRIRTNFDAVSRRMVVLFMVCCAAVGTWATYSDSGQSTNNVFAAAEVFGTPTPTVSPTPTTTPSPTPTTGGGLGPPGIILITPTPTPPISPSSTPTPTPTPSPSPSVQAGDVVINEVMWMGSQGTPSDEWIELRNMTSEAIDLTGWVIENAGTSASPNIVLSGVIPATGYWLLANNNSSASAVLDTLAIDQVTTSVEISNGGEQLILKNVASMVIDATPVTSGSWPHGDNSPLQQSMERNSPPSDGTNASNWHTCAAAICNDTTYWDAEGNNYGTPKDSNSAS